MGVFMLRWRTFLCDLLYNQALGEVEYYTYAIEFQKTGLPLVHMGLGIKRGSQLTCGKNIDAVISAEMPDPIKEPVLFDLVKHLMIHDPCNTSTPKRCHRPDPNDPTRKRCRFFFPKHYSETTIIDEGEIQ